MDKEETSGVGVRNSGNQQVVVSRTFLIFGLILSQVLLFHTKTHALPTTPIGSLSLAWDASSDPSVMGYRLYQGSQSQVYTSVTDVGSLTTATMSGLAPGLTYYFAVTAYDSSGFESAFSGEISYTVPTTSVIPPNLVAQLAVTFNPFSQAMLSGTAPAGYVYTVMATQDLSSWTAIGTVSVTANGQFQFIDPTSPLTSFRFYRLQQIATQSPAASPNSGVAALPKSATAGF